MNVLITSASRKVSLVQAFQEALKERVGRVFAADVNPLCAAFSFADARVVVPPSKSHEFIPFLLQFCRLHHIGLIVPTRDAELPLLSRASERFAAAGTLVAVSPPDVVETCQDKQRFVDYCESRGIPIPHTYRLNEPVRFPVFVKPARGSAARGTRIVETRQDWEQLRIERQGLVVQEVCHWTEYTIDVFSNWSGQVLSVVPRERRTVMGGESFVGVTRHIKELIADTVELAEQLGLCGHSTVQAFHRDGNTKFIEVNPRYGGGAALSFAAGAPSPEWLIRLALGQHLDSMVGQFTPDRYMLRYTQDVFIDEAEVKWRVA